MLEILDGRGDNSGSNGDEVEVLLRDPPLNKAFTSSQAYSVSLALLLNKNNQEKVETKESLHHKMLNAGILFIGPLDFWL